MEEMKVVEFWGFLGAMVLRAEREDREGLSEGGWFYKSYAWHASWIDFFMLSFLLCFSFFWAKQPGFWDWVG